MVKNCCVVQCTNDLRRFPNLLFHKFPVKKQLKKEWIRRLKMGRAPHRNSVVCSEHIKATDYETPFLGSRQRLKGSFPTERIPKTSLELSGIIKTKTLKERSLRLKNVSNVEVARLKLEVKPSPESEANVPVM